MDSKTSNLYLIKKSVGSERKLHRESKNVTWLKLSGIYFLMNAELGRRMPKSLSKIFIGCEVDSKLNCS